MNISKLNIKIRTSIVAIFSIIVLFVAGVMIYFQYKASNEFAIITTQKVFKNISDKVVSKIQLYDKQSIGFINIAEEIQNFDQLPNIEKHHVLLPIITKYIKSSNYVYGIYLGYSNNSFYIVYNLNLSQKMREAQHAPKNARWLVKKNIEDENGKFISYKEFLDENFNTVLKLSEVTSYKPTSRPWYRDASKSKNIIKTKPYIFSSLNQPGVTYAKKTMGDNGTVISLDITLSSLSKLLSSSNLVEGSAAFIFKKDGTVMGQTDNILNKTIKNVNNEYKNIFIKNNKVTDIETQIIVEIKGKKYFKYTTMLKSDLPSKDYLVILSPIDPILKPYEEKIFNTLLLTIFTLLFIVAPIIFYTIKLIVKPISQLQEENKKIEEGNLSDVKHVDSFMVEISSLSNSLVSMAKSIEESKRNLEIKIQERTADLEETKKEVEAMHRHTRDSIEYASLIQGALIPLKGSMEPYFKDHFVTWTPKDTVGGDIWLFEDLRHKDECLLMFIDCTGHGVPGAFVTMIVKAVEREIVSIINSSPDMDVSPAWVMSYFNQTIKKLLRQESKDSLSNAGWDGGVIYYNKKEQILKFAGAETPLFYMTKDGEFKTIKGNRYSVGYKKCAADYEYKETILNVEEGMKFYCTTDGYLDQNGGAKDFPFGKKRFGNIIKEHHTKPMVELQAIFQVEMQEYETMIENNDRNDDMTVIAFEIDKYNG